MTMVMQRITASRFKARCLALLDEVESSRQPLEVTKHGRPVARVVPIEGVPPLRGSVTYNVDDDELLGPIDVEWDSTRE